MSPLRSHRELYHEVTAFVEIELSEKEIQTAIAEWVLRNKGVDESKSLHVLLYCDRDQTNRGTGHFSSTVVHKR